MFVHLIQLETKRQQRSGIVYRRYTTARCHYGMSLSISFSLLLPLLLFPLISICFIYPYCHFFSQLDDARRIKLTNRNLTHSHIYKNLETNQSIRSVTPRNELEKECGKIDIYVRTSDVRRLSDFQMWQVSSSSIPPGCQAGYGSTVKMPHYGQDATREEDRW